MSNTTSTRPAEADSLAGELEQSPVDDENPAAVSNERTEQAADPTEGTGLSQDLLFESLKNSRRRQVVRYLLEHEPPVTLGELAEHVAAIENDTTVQALSSQQRKRVYVGLYQCHLPKLDDMAIVEYDKNRGRVEPGPNVEQLEPYLEVDEAETEDEASWNRDVAAGALVGASGVTLVAALAGAGAATPAGAAGLGLLVGLAALSLADASRDLLDRLPWSSPD